MPRVAEYALIWSPEREAYALSTRGSTDHDSILEDDASWFAWLAARSSFSFQCKLGHMTLRKESRPRGEGYWYAYRNQGRKTAKLYVGRNSDLTIARLEATARTLSSITSEKHTVPESGVQVMDEARQEPLLLAPKLHLPRLHNSHVLRERLLAQLDAALERKLILLSAPAGFGKTTLVSQWLASRKTSSGENQHFQPVAWVSLDGGDNDPVRFWRYIITASQSFQTDLGKSALVLLLAERTAWHPAFERPALEAVLTMFLNELSQVPAGVLVLEDYHLITSPQIHEALAYLIEHLPASLHIVIITRSDPPLPLARLRAHDELVELHAADLRFSLDEARAFFQQVTPFSLSSEVLMRLEARTEGWVTGLRLLALALQGRAVRQEIEDFLMTFAGSHRHVLDFFVTEVLCAQPETLQLFLLQTSVLDRLTGSLCDAVTGRDDSELLLETLERANLFLQPLDGAGQWHRYHTLFAEAMQYEARRRLGEDALRSCYGKASCWYEQHDMLAEAIEAALSARDFARAVMLIERLTEESQVMEGHELHTLRRWLEQVPEAVMEGHPVLCLYYAAVQAFSSDHMTDLTPVLFERVETSLQMAERAWRADGKLAKLGEVLAFRSLMSIWQGDSARAATLARQALAWLPEEELLWRGTSLSIVANGELEMGQFDTARKTMQQGLELCEASGNRFAVRASIITLGEVYCGQGELRRAAELYRQVLIQAKDDNDMADRERALVGLSQITYEWNELESTQQQAQEAFDLGERLGDTVCQKRSSLVLAHVLHARGETQKAQHILLTTLAQTPTSSSTKSPALDREILACQAQFSLAEGDLSAAQRWSITRTPYDEALPRTQLEREELLVARLLTAQGQAEEAIQALESCLTRAHEAGRIRSALESQLLMTLAYASRKQAQKVRSLLREVLTLAHSEGYQRLFLDEGEPMADLLRSTLSEIREKPLITYIHTLLRAFAHTSTPASPSTLLSPQEVRVLRLLAAGQSRQEIARELVVSINTVKTHLQRIYQKLNVTSRQEAREAARSLHLL
jgi:LuxR family transcriptional regulator, maltose regulon positive regulatory protein